MEQQQTPKWRRFYKLLAKLNALQAQSIEETRRLTCSHSDGRGCRECMFVLAMDAEVGFMRDELDWCLDDARFDDHDRAEKARREDHEGAALFLENRRWA